MCMANSQASKEHPSGAQPALQAAVHRGRPGLAGSQSRHGAGPRPPGRTPVPPRPQQRTGLLCSSCQQAGAVPLGLAQRLVGRDLGELPLVQSLNTRSTASVSVCLSVCLSGPV